jgi:membrane-associated phospholipid phosphatase
MEEKYLRISARVLSAIFTPFYVPTVGFLALFLFTYLRMLPLSYQIVVLGIVYAFTVPMLGIYIYQKINGWSLRHLGHKEKRIVPYAMTILSYVCCLLLMYRLSIPRSLSGIIVAALMAMIICAVINVWWKISAHMTAIGEFVGGLVSFSFVFYYNPLGWFCFAILLSGALGTSRIILRQHSLSQVLVGFLVGFVCGILGILFI